MTREYWVDWLTPQYAAQAARLERKVHPKDYCAGYHSILGDLRKAEANGCNLSLGVFNGQRLVGFLLAFREPERARICDYIDVKPPKGIDLSGPGIYLNDFVVHSDHRGAGVMMALRLTQIVRVRDDLRTLPVDTFSTNTMTDTWSQKVKYLKRMSIELSERAPLGEQAGGEELFWIVFRHVTPATRDKQKASLVSARLKHRKTFSHEGRNYQIGTITSVSDWALLAPFWNELLHRSRAATVFQTYEYLTTWWSLLGLKNELFITVILLDEQPVLIAPMQIGRAKSLGRNRRCLSFIGHPSEVDRNTLLGDEHVSGLIDHIADHHLQHRDLWDFIALYEQPEDGALLKALAKKLRSQQFTVTEVPGPPCAIVTIDGDWAQFLAQKPKPFRKSIKRRLAKAQAQNLQMQSFDDPDPDTAELALARYYSIESASWKREAALGIGKSASHLSFFRQIVRTFAAAHDAAFQFVTIGGSDAAGTFGLRWAGTFYSLHIAHDEKYAEHSPGVTLTALEMQAAFTTKRYRTFDFLGGFMSNKRSWATSTTPTVALFAHPPGFSGWAFHTLHFRMRPVLRRFLVRFRLLEAALATKQIVKKLRAH
jgi:CelD/BcsL family acetyltransferase involved in cellulose biosynthesis